MGIYGLAPAILAPEPCSLRGLGFEAATRTAGEPFTAKGNGVSAELLVKPMRREDSEDRDELTSPSASRSLDETSVALRLTTGIAATRDDPCFPPLWPEAAPDRDSDKVDTVSGVLPAADALSAAASLVEAISETVGLKHPARQSNTDADNL